MKLLLLIAGLLLPDELYNLTLAGSEYFRSGVDSRDGVEVDGSRYLLKSVGRLKSPNKDEAGGAGDGFLLVAVSLLPLLMVVLLLLSCRRCIEGRREEESLTEDVGEGPPDNTLELHALPLRSVSNPFPKSKSGIKSEENAFLVDDLCNAVGLLLPIGSSSLSASSSKSSSSPSELSSLSSLESATCARENQKRGHYHALAFHVKYEMLVTCECSADRIEGSFSIPASEVERCLGQSMDSTVMRGRLLARC